MLFLARLRAIALSLPLLSAALCHARQEVLFTSSVTYCAPPESVLVQKVDILYYNSNQSVFFNISAASVDSNLNVSANLMVNVYGMVLVNATIDLCNILGGALCPLPEYDFQGSDTITLPASLDVASRVPSIAFGVPDLEGFAQLELIEEGSGDIKACVQATLSNGWSTHQPSVEWTTGGIALAILLVATWLSLSDESIIPQRLLELLYLYQTIASSSFLDLNYPSIYRAFTMNFAWALGFFSSATSNIQDSINDMRALTGGNMANSSSGSAVAFVDRKLSPYNTIVDAVSFSSNVQTLTKSLVASAFNSTRLLSARDSTDVQTVTEDSSNVLDAGLPIFVNSIHVSTANAFMTVFITALDLIAITLAAFALIYAALYLMRRFTVGRSDRRLYIEQNYVNFVRSWSLRMGMIAFTPILIFSFYQWTLKDSWLSILFSVLSFIAVIACVAYPSYRVIRQASTSSPYSLYSNAKEIVPFGPLYVQYRVPRYYFFVPLLIGAFLRSVFISFAKDSGLAQVILLLLLECGIVALHILLKPQKTRGGDVFSTYLAIVRMVSAGLMIAFLERVGLAAIPRVVVGCVIGVIFCAAILVVIINIGIHLQSSFSWQRRQKRDNDDLESPVDCKPMTPIFKDEQSSNGDYSSSSIQETHLIRESEGLPEEPGEISEKHH